MRAPIAPVFVLIFLLGSIGAAVADYPTLVYYVTDQVDVLTTSEEYDIEDLCVAVYEQTGAEVAVLIVNSTLPDSIETYAVKTFEQNGLGDEDRDDGLLILISASESTWRIEVGYGLEGILPDARVGTIAEDHLVPFVQSGDYYTGIYETTYAITTEILANYEGTPQDSGSQYPIPWIPLKTWQLVVVLGVIIGLAVVTRGRTLLLWLLFSRNCGGGGKSWGGGRSGGGGASGKW